MRTILLVHVLALQTSLAFASPVHATTSYLLLADSLICPAQVVVACEQLSPNLLDYGLATVTAGTCLDSILSTADLSQFDTVCSRGTIARRFQVSYCDGSSAECVQNVVVNHTQNFFIKFPDDIYSDFCDGTNDYGMPVVFGDDCEMVVISYNDQIVTPVPDACIIILRDWTIINWCTFNPQMNVDYVPNPRPSPFNQNPSNHVGPIVSACGTAPPWASTVVKLTPTDLAPTDYCTFWNPNANGYKYTQSIRVFDYIGPVFTDCASSTSSIADTTDNDPEYWNLDPTGLDLAETAVDLNTTLTDVCYGGEVGAPYQLYLDLNADGVWETVIDSRFPQPTGMLRYDNANTPNYMGGTLLAFDNRPVPTEQKWRFVLQWTSIGTESTMSVRWNTEASPNTLVVPELPNGRHKIQWNGEDQCGNTSLCERLFNVGDTLLVSTLSPQNQGFALFQNEPNPFGSNTRIRFELPEYTTATLSVWDASGRVLYRQTDDYAPGIHSVNLGKENLGTPGVLFYKLEAGAHVAWRKMVLGW